MSFNATDLNLLLAIQKRDLKQFIEILIKTNTMTAEDFTRHDKEGNTLLHHAMLTRNNEISLLLIRAGAKVNTKNHSGLAPINICFSMNSPIFDLSITSKQHSEKSIKKELNRSPKLGPKLSPKLDRSPKLSPKKLEPRKLSNAYYLTLTPSFEILSQLQFKTLETLLTAEKDLIKKRGVKKFLKNYRHQCQPTWTPLMLATMMGRGDIVRILLDYGFNDFHPGQTQETALSIALKLNFRSIAQLLIFKQVSDVNQALSLQQNNASNRVPLLYYLLLSPANNSLKSLTLLLNEKFDFSLFPEFDPFTLIEQLKKNKLLEARLDAAQKSKIEQFYNDAKARIHHSLEQTVAQLMAESTLINSELKEYKSKEELEVRLQKVTKEHSLKDQKDASFSANKSILKEWQGLLIKTHQLNQKIAHLRKLLETSNYSKKSIKTHKDYSEASELYLTNQKQLLDSIYECHPEIFRAPGCLGIVAEYLDEGLFAYPLIYQYKQKSKAQAQQISKLNSSSSSDLSYSFDVPRSSLFYIPEEECKKVNTRDKLEPPLAKRR